MQHHPAVAKRPSGSVFYLVTYEPILNHQEISRKLLFIKHVTKLVFELSAILIITYFNSAILYPERISEIIIHRMIFDLNRPAIEVFSVEELYPLFLFGFFLSINH